MRLFGILCVLALAAAGGARADVIPACPVPAGATLIGFDQLPTGVRKALAQQTGPMAQPGQPFNVGDVVTKDNKSQPHWRGIFVWGRGTRWVVATEHGGYGYNDPVFLFDAASNGKRVALTAKKMAVPATVCATAQGLLDMQ